MLPVEVQSYAPVLRLKQGEYEAVREIRPDVRGRLLPHWLLMPPKEPDPEKRRPLTDEEAVYESARRVAKHWPLQTCLLDPRYLFDRFEEERAEQWLFQLFSVATDWGARPIPVAALSDLQGHRLRAYQSIAHPENIGFALRLTLNDLGDLNLRARVHAALLKLVAKPHQCLLILDMSGADFSQISPMAEYYALAYQQVMEIGLWRRVIVQATSYPEINPAQPGSQIVLPRNEWPAWQNAVAADPELLRNLMFGDFAADSGKFVFKKGGKAIAHYRYSRGNKWLVVRGTTGARAADAMLDVSSKVLDSGLFCGRGFSSGDRYIFDTAHSLDGPGNPSIWRKVNTIHHITDSVQNIGAHYGYTIEVGSSEAPPVQTDLFGRNG